MQEHFDKTGRWLGDPQLQEPPTTPFAGSQLEAELNAEFGFSLRLTPTESIEEWAMRLWQEVRAGVAANAYGPGQITWGDLANYERFTGVPLSEFRVRLLLLIDNAFRRHYRPESAPQQEK